MALRGQTCQSNTEGWSIPFSSWPPNTCSWMFMYRPDENRWIETDEEENTCRGCRHAHTSSAHTPRPLLFPYWRVKRASSNSTFLTKHHPFISRFNVVPSLVHCSHEREKKRTLSFSRAKRCEVLFSHKGRVFVMAVLSVPDSKLCALRLFSPLYTKDTPPPRSYWPGIAGISHLVGWETHQGTFGRFSFVYMPGEKTPITTVTLSNQTISSKLVRHKGCELPAHPHTRTHTVFELTWCLKPNKMKRFCSDSVLWQTWHKTHCVFLCSFS